MSIATQDPCPTDAVEIEFVTFRVGDILLGADIQAVEEINRYVEATFVPHAPEYVQGVINLRGEVVSIIDLRTILGLAPTQISKRTRIVVVNSRDEQIGLLVDSISDVVKARADQIQPTPANLGGVNGRHFKGVHRLGTELLVILEIDAALAFEGNAK